MNKIELNKYIESISNQIPLVHSYYTADVYEIWNTLEVKYGSLSFCITSSSVEDNNTTWEAILYYADRLLEDKSNRDSIQQDAINVINSIVNVIIMDEDITTVQYPLQIELFEQKFTDFLAGGYATIRITTPNSVSKCGYGYVKEEEGCEGTINKLESEIRQLNNEIDEKDEIIEDLEYRLDNIQTVDFSVIGYSEEDNKMAYSELQHNIQRSQELLEYWESNTSNSYNTDGFKDIVYSPMFDFTNRKIIGLSELFLGCRKLKTIPLLDTSSVRDINWMFGNCINLENVPLLDTSSVTNMTYTFAGCSNLENVPLLDTSSVTNMENTFSNCSKLKTIPLLDTSSVTNMSYMFYHCSNLENIPLLDTSSVTKMNFIFIQCSKLTTIPPINTSNVTNVSDMFNSCTSLESIPLLDFSSVTSISSIFGYSNITSLTDLGGFTGLKINWTSYGLNMCPNLTRQSLLNVFNTIADVRELGGKKLTIGNTNLSKLSNEDKMIAINKGWTLS